MEIKNRKANDYEFSDTLEAGIILVGREIKAVVGHEADLTGSRCIIKEVPIIAGSYIKLDQDRFSTPYDPNRDRKLLLNRSEIRWLQEKIKKGFSVIPIKLYQKKGKVKVLLGVGRKMKSQDKRQKLKEEAIKKDNEKENN